MAQDPTQPTYVRSELAAMRPTLALMADLLAGPQHMWEKSGSYIRKWKDEDPAVYDIRRKAEPLFGGLSRILSAATGMLFAKPPAMEWNVAEGVMSPLWDNIDNAGTKGPVFLKQFAEAAIRDGLGILLVDYTVAPSDVVVHSGNEHALGLRPVWARYERAQAVNWRVEMVNNRSTLTQLTLMETVMVPEGDFGVKPKMQFRDLRMVEGVAEWRLWTETSAVANQYAVTATGIFRNRVGQLATALPVAIAYTGRTSAPMTAEVPLAGVAYANLQHWRYATNLTFNREVCGFEQLVVTGQIAPNPATQRPGTLQIGPLVGIHLETGGTAAWIGPSGKGLEQLEKGAAEQMVLMDQQGLGFLIPNKTVTTTATEARLDSYAQLSTLATVGIGLGDAVNYAWEVTAWYEGIPKIGAPMMTINTDFESELMDSGTMLAYVALVNAGFPKMQALMALQVGGRIHEDADLEVLELEWESGLAADREAKRATAEASAKEMPNGDPAQMPSV